MLFGLSASVAGGWVALGIRGSAEARKELRRRGHEPNALVALATLAADTFTPRPNKVTRTGLRPYAPLVGLAGFVLVLAGFALVLAGVAEPLTGG
ncbi:hypothetical protein [Streptomyces sp. NPDC002516]